MHANVFISTGLIVVGYLGWVIIGYHLRPGHGQIMVYPSCAWNIYTATVFDGSSAKNILLYSVT